MRERRQVPRYRFNSPGKLLSSSNQTLAEITFTTLSVRGCRVRGSNVPAVGQKYILAFDWEGREFQSEVEVKWKKPDGHAGLWFLEIDEANLELIRRICATLHLEPLAPPPPESDDD